MHRFRKIAWAVAGWVLLLIMPILWMISYARADTFIWLRGGNTSLAVASYQGRAVVTFIAPKLTIDQPPQWVHLDDPTVAGNLLNSALDTGRAHGFRSLYWATTPNNMVGGGLTIVVPHWLLSLPGLIAIARMVFKVFRQRFRHRPGMCLQCGYDLRESPQRCPECGRQVDPEAAAPIEKAHA